MSETYEVAVLIGSLRKESYSRKLARVLERLAPEGLRFDEVHFARAPLYNEDIETSGNLPPEWVHLREQVRRSDAVLFITPEYNRSIPGGLKNALDIGSRPPKENVWRGKPAAIASISRGVIGAFGANHHLRQILVPLDVLVMAQPEAYIGGAPTLFDEQGELTNESTREFLQGFMRRFAQWIETVHRGQERAAG